MKRVERLPTAVAGMPIAVLPLVLVDVFARLCCIRGLAARGER